MDREEMERIWHKRRLQRLTFWASRRMWTMVLKEIKLILRRSVSWYA